MDPDANRLIGEEPLWFVLQRLAVRCTKDTMDTELKALADMRAALERTIHARLVLDRALGRTWASIAVDLGVSPQAAQQRYGGHARG